MDMHRAAALYTAYSIIHGFAVMISSPAGADDIPSLSAWIKKSESVSFRIFWQG